MLFRPCLFSLTLMALGGCAGSAANSNGHDISLEGQVRDRLSTHIADNGLKLFTYTVSNSSVAAQLQPQRYRLNQTPPEGNGQRRKHTVAANQQLSDWTHQVEIGLAQSLAMAAFCHEGHIEISRLILPERAEIRGECVDGASIEDRRRFSGRG